MAFNPNPPRQDYVCNDGQITFPFNFKIFYEKDITVWYTVKDSGTTVELAPSDYTVTINGDAGGSVELIGLSVSAGDFIVLERILDIDRPTEYQTSGDLLASTLNYDQDYQTYLISDLKSRVTQSISAPPGTPGFDGQLPAPVSEAYLRWSQDGRSLENDTQPPLWNVETKGYRDEAESFRDQAATSATSAASSDQKAYEWAENPEDIEVEPGAFSAKHWAIKASNSGVTPPTFPQDEGKVWTARSTGNKWETVPAAQIDDTTPATDKVYSSSKTEALVSSNASIGVGQTWQDVSASRVENTDYVNDTGRPIQVSISTNTNGESSGTIAFLVDGVELYSFSWGLSFSSVPYVINVIIPPNSTYRFENNNTNVIVRVWAELR